MTNEDHIKAIMYDHLNGKLTLLEALLAAHRLNNPYAFDFDD